MDAARDGEIVGRDRTGLPAGVEKRLAELRAPDTRQSVHL
jgi:hypothetical protein